MPKLLKPSNDLIFKYVFGNEKNKDILAAFLMSVLQMPEEVEDLTILNPETTSEKLNDKRAILDILVHTRSKHMIHVEIQVEKDASMRERTTFYASKKYGSQLESGEKTH